MVSTVSTCHWRNVLGSNPRNHQGVSCNPTCRSNFEKNFEVEEVYDGDVSCIQVAKCKLNDEKVVIKKFKKAKLMERPDLQHKVMMPMPNVVCLLQ